MNNLYLDTNQITTLFNEGVLTTAIVVSAPMEQGYNLLFTTKEKSTITCSKSRTTDPRVFKTFETAAALAKKIGFRKLEVEL